MMRKPTLVALVLAIIMVGVLWGMSHTTRYPRGFSGLVFRRETGDLDAGDYKSVALTAVRRTFDAYCYLQIAPERRIREIEWRFGFLTFHKRRWGSRSVGLLSVDATVQAWALLTVLSVYPTIAFARGPIRRRWRRRRSLCVRCGYDLSMNVSGVCPECGVRRRVDDSRWLARRGS